MFYSRNGAPSNDSSAYEMFLDHELAKEDTQIVEKDRMDHLQPKAEDSHVGARTLSLSVSRIASIRNTSIYQDFRFAHLSGVACSDENSAEEAVDELSDDCSLVNLFKASMDPKSAQRKIEEAANESQSGHDESMDLK